MTRSLRIVNTSNWDGEDFKVRMRPKSLLPTEWSEVCLKPGEMTNCYSDWELQIEKIESKDPKPFYLNGKQVFPRIKTFVGYETEEKWPETIK